MRCCSLQHSLLFVCMPTRRAFICYCAPQHTAPGGYLMLFSFRYTHCLLARYIVIAWFSLQCQMMYSTHSFFSAVFWYIKQQQPVVAGLYANVYVRPPHIGSRSLHATKGGNVTHTAQLLLRLLLHQGAFHVRLTLCIYVNILFIVGKLLYKRAVVGWRTVMLAGRPLYYLDYH